MEAGLLSPEDRTSLPTVIQSCRLDSAQASFRARAIATALRSGWSRQDRRYRRQFQQWKRQQRHWLTHHCQFMVLRHLQEGRPWWDWPAPLAQRHRHALRALEAAHSDALLEEALLQWQLHQQWQRLQRCARKNGVMLVGDMPFYVAHDSADVWRNQALFRLDETGSLIEQSGVPPDYFSDTGQLWGTPVYRWWRHKLQGFRWWMHRLERQLELFDLLRLDHFRALQAYWSVPGNDLTAQYGHWKPSPGLTLLRLLRWRCRLRRQLLPNHKLPLIAEDLGVITPAVEALRDTFQLPGMKILQFAFNGDVDNPYLPGNFQGEHWVVYTGTHDNATTLGWWKGLDHDSKARVGAVVGAEIHAPSWQLLELALASRAMFAVVPIQDLLELDDQARFNTPGTNTGNWTWRLDRTIADLQGPIGGFGNMAANYGRGAATALGG